MPTFEISTSNLPHHTTPYTQHFARGSLAHRGNCLFAFRNMQKANDEDIEENRTASIEEIEIRARAESREETNLSCKMVCCRWASTWWHIGKHTLHEMMTLRFSSGFVFLQFFSFFALLFSYIFLSSLQWRTRTAGKLCSTLVPTNDEPHTSKISNAILRPKLISNFRVDCIVCVAVHCAMITNRTRGTVYSNR